MSIEFRDHREYQPGDDPRHLDWPAYARSDRLTIKLFEEEVRLHLDVLVDGSRSMALDGSEKERATVATAALLARAARNAGFSHSVWLAGEGWTELPCGRLSPVEWTGFSFVSSADPARTFQKRPPPCRPQGVRVLLSDLLWSGDPPAHVGVLARGAAGLHVVQVLARDEVEPPLAGNVELVDCETGETREVLVDPPAVRRYKRALARHRESWSDASRRFGATFSVLVAEELTARWDLRELVRSGVLETRGARATGDRGPASPR